MKVRAVKGMNDILPDEARRFQYVERVFRETVESYGFSELRTPIVEELSLFHKSTGETSEVVQKQMFLLDRRSEKLALRPEGTPSAARVYIGQNQHAREPITKWYYIGPMFRAEQPQRGRYRQFHQAGCELFGDAGPLCDVEMIAMLHSMGQTLGIRDLEMRINTLGSAAARSAYRTRLRDYFEPIRDQLSEHAQARIQDNPLRILDSKDPRDQQATQSAPLLWDSLADEDRAHFEGVKAGLDAIGVPYVVDAKLVRGLDYYTRTCFELVAESGSIGSQNSILGGGRYDGMLAGLGGQDLPAIGFAMGLERVLLALEESEVPRPPLCFVAPLGEGAQLECLKIAQALRSEGVTVELDSRGNSLKSMLRRANTMGAAVCLVMGQSELDAGEIQLKNLRCHEQRTVPIPSIPTEVAAAFEAALGAATGEERDEAKA